MRHMQKHSSKGRKIAIAILNLLKVITTSLFSAAIGILELIGSIVD